MKCDVNRDACEIVVNYVTELIASQTLNVGDRLEPERNLAEKLNVSRATVREAIKVLNHIGYVDSTQGSGNYVSNKYDRTVSSIMRVMYLRGELGVDNFIRFRQMLELQAFELALGRASEEQKNEMVQIVDLLDICKDSALIFSLDSRFHAILVEAANDYLISMNYTALSSVIQQYMSDSFFGTVSKKKDGFQILQKHHRAIVDAFIRGDLEGGRQAIIDHFTFTQSP